MPPRYPSPDGQGHEPNDFDIDWAAVRNGKMKRKAFDQQVDTVSRIGQMDPELAAQAKRTLDSEGF